MTQMPTWKMPKNLDKALEDGDGMWEDERWSPILVTAMSGTELNGREIPIAWQSGRAGSRLPKPTGPAGTANFIPDCRSLKDDEP